MKNLVIIMAVLVVMIMVHGFDNNRAEKFKEDLIKCRREVGLHKYQPYKLILLCAFGADGSIYDEHEAIKKDAVLNLLEHVIANETILEQAQTKFKTCYDDVVGNAVISHQHTDILGMCTAPIVKIFITLQ
ncbi:uncharacterized protein LOC116853087 [Odontomachus brunneus]|uniref:uncharacterized protein LOC116853087 n=1 Tax=Odontomachus brunneus TaxID=486640 RepID=UPI0013F1BE27|nr:uncharacterized protein LOC116853087 [Odontomachus brunneus]